MGPLEKRCVAEEALRVVVARVSDVCVPYALLPFVVVAVDGGATTGDGALVVGRSAPRC